MDPIFFGDFGIFIWIFWVTTLERGYLCRTEWGWCHQLQGLGMRWSFPVLTSGVDIEGDPASQEISERLSKTAGKGWKRTCVKFWR